MTSPSTHRSDAGGQPAAAAFPCDLPERLVGPSAWRGPAMAARGGWIEPLSDAELRELAAATLPWLATGRELTDLRKSEFPLPSLRHGPPGCGRN